MSDLRIPVPRTLVGAIWPATASYRGRVLRAAALVVAGSVILAVSARAQVPFYPVPMTLQSLAVVLIGAVYGARLGTLTLAVYLMEGLLGLPVLANTPERGLGLAYMMGPTGGFLLGFLPAAAIVGWVADRGGDRSFGRMLAAVVAAHVVLFALGFAWLAHLAGPSVAWIKGVQPFLLGTAVKTLLAALVVPAAWDIVARRRQA